VSDPVLEHSALTDAALLGRAANGDRQAFDVFVERHQARVFRFARAQVARPDDAEDLLQQTFLSAWQGAGAFRGIDSARAWLFTITRHAASRLRDQHRREALDDTRVEELGIQAGWGQSSPEFTALRREIQAEVAAALEALPADDRAILTVRDLEGVSGEEAAALFGLSLPAMKSRLHRARLRLAAELRRGGRDAAR